MPDLSFMWLFCLALRATVLFAHIWQNLDSKLATESFVTCSPTRPPPHLKHAESTLSRAHAVAMVTAVNSRVLPVVLGGELTVTSDSTLLLKIISYLNRVWYGAVSCCPPVFIHTQKGCSVGAFLDALFYWFLISYLWRRLAACEIPQSGCCGPTHLDLRVWCCSWSSACCCCPPVFPCSCSSCVVCF